MRRPAGTGFCCAMISFTFETAVGVRLMGALGVVSTLGVVVVAICGSPDLGFLSQSQTNKETARCTELDYTRRSLLIPLVLQELDVISGAKVARSQRNRCVKNLDFTGNCSIIMPLGLRTPRTLGRARPLSNWNLGV